ncbi:MAG: hypothetical protein IJP31_09250 [Lachnospiraceae bacterium]|nr:hypothetical protein [Lachnospiraceae bacterium]
MEKERVFQVLGIEETKDEAAIKAAYRGKLTGVNPEDNPEGFKRLREAYEEALRLAKQEETEIVQEDEVSCFIRRTNLLYQSIADRLDEEQWKELLQDPVLEDLDLGEKAKWQLFSYLADHYRLPSSIWKILAEHFRLRENEEEFMEHFAPGFVDFMLQKSTTEEAAGEFPYAYLKGENRADYDGFLQDFSELIRMMRGKAEDEDQAQWEKAVEEKIRGMESYGISHPWFTMQKARFDFAVGKKAEAVEAVYALWEKYTEDMQLKLDGAIILADCESKEEEKKAEETFLFLLEGSQHMNVVFDAHMELTRIYLRQDEVLKAREHVLKASDIYDNSVVEELLTDCNTRLIRLFTEKEKELTVEEGMKLAWAYIQTRRGEEGYEWFEKHPVLTEDSAPCHRTKAVLYLVSDHIREALEETRIWQKLQPLEEKKDIVREAQSYEIEGRCLVRLYTGLIDKEEASSEAEALKKSALTAFDTALEKQPEDIDFIMSKMLFLRDLEEYEDMLQLCVRLTELDAGFYWGPFYAQEACEKLGRAQEVVDYFYEAKEIYPGRPEIYDRAARVFRAYGQFSEVENILNQAREAEVDSLYLKVRRLELQRRNAKEIEEYREIDSFAEELIRELEEKKESGKDIPKEEIPEEWLGDAYMQRAYLQDEGPREFRVMEVLENCAIKAVELEDSLRSLYFLGRFYCEYLDENKKAFPYLKTCEERGMEFEWLDYYLGQCYEDMKEWDKAREAYMRGMEKAPDLDEFAWRVGWLYRTKFNRTGQKVYYDEALKYLEIHRERFGDDSTTFWQLSDLYSRNGEYEKALEAIDQALQKDKQARNWGKRGTILKMLSREEAFYSYEKAAEAGLSQDEDYEYAYDQLYRWFRRRKKYREGIAYFEQLIPRMKEEENRHEYRERLKDFYLYLGEKEKALEVISRLFGGSELDVHVCDSWKKEGERIDSVLEIYRYMDSDEEIAKKAEQALRLLNDPAEERLEESHAGKRMAYKEIGLCYATVLDEETAVSQYERALKEWEQEEDRDEDDYQGILDCLLRCLWQLNRLEEAGEYARKYLDSHLLPYAECEGMEKPPEELHSIGHNMGKYQNYHLFIAYFFSGDYEQAGKYLKRLENSSWCWHCPDKVCSEEWEIKGYWAMWQKKTEEAKLCFQKALEGHPTNIDAIIELKRLSKQP